MKYTWGYHGSDAGYVHVATIPSDKPESNKLFDPERNELFDVTLYDETVLDEETGVDCREQSLRDLRTLIGYANAALRAGLAPEWVPDSEENEQKAAQDAVSRGVWEEA